ncbi:hypothetical protein KQH61_00350 [bacterium]|nr:hypothetical protein [bacterium]
METENIYTQLIENLGNPTFNVDVNEDSSFSVRVVDAINQLYTKKNRAAYQALEAKYEYESLSDVEKSLFIEIKILDLFFQNQKVKNRALRNQVWEEIVTSAKEALLLNPRGAISRAMLARYAFISSMSERGFTLLLEVLEDYPKANWIYIDLVRLMVLAGNYKPTRPYIGKISDPIWRILYFLTINILQRFSLIISFGYFFGVNFLPQSFWLSIAVLGPLGIIAIYSIIMNERPLTIFYVSWFFMLLFITIIPIVFRNADGVDDVGYRLFHRGNI